MSSRSQNPGIVLPNHLQEMSCKILHPFGRFMFGLAALPSAIMFVGCLWLPESPSWLVSRGACEHAREVLVRIRGTANVNEELQAIRTVCKEQESYDKKSKFLNYWRVGLSIDTTRSVKILRVVLFEFEPDVISRQ